jgi:hypothetical protein
MCYARKDYLGSGRFVRLWKNLPQLGFQKGNELHLQQYPVEINKVMLVDYPIIHYGYAREEYIIGRWFVRTRLGVPKNIRLKCVDESNLELVHVSHDLLPKCFLPEKCVRPEQKYHGEDTI